MTNPNSMYPVLYTPATTDIDKLVPLINGANEDAHRVVVCTEDSVREDHVPMALDNLETMIQQYEPEEGVEVFVRARNPQVLDRMLDMPSVERVTGFVVPKADPDGFPEYGELVKKHDANFIMMPILESPEMTDAVYRRDLLQMLSDSEYREHIDCLRIGGNDLMGHQGLRRDDLDLTIYDTVVGTLIGNIVNEFRGTGGFDITAPVFECYAPDYDNLLRKELRHNIVNRLLGQTVIHPRHLKIVNEAYRVRSDHLASAKEMVDADAEAVCGREGRMDEQTTHHKWASSILMRAEMFGTV